MNQEVDGRGRYSLTAKSWGITIGGATTVATVLCIVPLLSVRIGYAFSFNVGVGDLGIDIPSLIIGAFFGLIFIAWGIALVMLLAEPVVTARTIEPSLAWRDSILSTSFLTIAILSTKSERFAGDVTSFALATSAACFVAALLAFIILTSRKVVTRTVRDYQSFGRWALLFSPIAVAFLWLPSNFVQPGFSAWLLLPVLIIAMIIGLGFSPAGVLVTVIPTMLAHKKTLSIPATAVAGIVVCLIVFCAGVTTAAVPRDPEVTITSWHYIIIAVVMFVVALLQFPRIRLLTSRRSGLLSLPSAVALISSLALLSCVALFYLGQDVAERQKQMGFEDDSEWLFGLTAQPACLSLRGQSARREKVLLLGPNTNSTYLYYSENRETLRIPATEVRVEYLAGRGEDC